MSSLLKKLYAPRVFDGLFLVAGIVTIVGLIPAMGNNYPAVVASGDPLTKGAAVIAMLLASLLLAIYSARIDQKTADDFVFMMIMKSGYLAFYASLFAVTLWEAFLRASLGGLSAPACILLMIGAWSLSYLYVRIRGTGAAS